MPSSTVPPAGDGTLTHDLYVSLVSSQMETVSKMCHSKLGQYHLALLISPHFKSKNSKSFVSCNRMNCCLQKHTTHQFTYFIYYSCQDMFKNSRIIKTHQVHQRIHIKQFLLFCLTYLAQQFVKSNYFYPIHLATKRE